MLQKAMENLILFSFSRETWTQFMVLFKHLNKHAMDPCMSKSANLTWVFKLLMAQSCLPATLAVYFMPPHPHPFDPLFSSLTDVSFPLFERHGTA